jgi:hypothetical protein
LRSVGYLFRVRVRGRGRGRVKLRLGLRVRVIASDLRVRLGVKYERRVPRVE